jgi:hypothetical protein
MMLEYLFDTAQASTCLHNQIWSECAHASDSNARLCRTVRRTNTCNQLSVCICDKLQDSLHPKVIAKQMPAWQLLVHH